MQSGEPPERPPFQRGDRPPQRRSDEGAREGSDRPRGGAGFRGGPSRPPFGGRGGFDRPAPGRPGGPGGERPPFRGPRPEGGFEQRGPRPERPTYGERPPFRGPRPEGGFEQRGPRPERPTYGERPPFRGPRPEGGFEQRGPRPERPAYGERPPFRGPRPEGGFEQRGPRPERPTYGERPERPPFRREGPSSEGPRPFRSGLPSGELQEAALEEVEVVLAPVDVEEVVAPTEVEATIASTEGEGIAASAEAESALTPIEVEEVIALTEAETAAAPTESAVQAVVAQARVSPLARTDAHLRATLRRIDGRPYPAYNDIVGVFAYPGFALRIDAVQQDPFAPATRLSVRVPLADTGIASDLLTSPVRRTAVADFIVRTGARTLREALGYERESLLAVDHGDQEVLQRSCCVVGDDFVEVRLRASLPAEGRFVRGAEADDIFGRVLPAFVASALSSESLTHRGIRRHVEDVEDQVALRAELAGRHLVAFVADGSILPRATGTSQKPLTGADVVPFKSPAELRVELSAPNRGKVTGMGVPEGVTVVIGGGFHGKSTLLNAIARGVYDQIPGDGREAVVTRADAFVIRAEPGRPVERGNISAFIDNLPFAKDTSTFTTDNASGSTSMAANIVEALEAGTGLLIVDEDTSASNFLFRDARMQRLVPDDAEPIRPYVDLARALFEENRVSTIIAVSGSGDYLDVADTVILMRDYLPSVVTEQARQIARELPTQRRREGRRRLGPVSRRTIVAESVDPQRKGRERVRARGHDAIEFGTATIDVSSLTQLVDAGQARAIADLLSYCWHRRYFEDEAAIADALARGLSDAERRGLETLSPHGEAGDYAMPRLLEAIAALNRLRGIRVRQIGA